MNRRPWVLAGVAVAISAAAAIAIVRSSDHAPADRSLDPVTPRPVLPVQIERDERDGLSSNPRRVLARIQSNLERTAAGATIWRVHEPEKPDDLEVIVDAYAAFMKGDEAQAITTLAAAEAEAKARAPSRDAGGVATKPGAPEVSPWIEGYLDKINAALGKEGAPPPSLLARLAGALRRVDGVLLAELREDELNPIERKDTAAITPARSRSVESVWLSLPCRTVVGRTADFTAAAERLGPLAGPLLSCPVPEGLERDFARMERFARDPGATVTEVLPAPSASAAPKKDPAKDAEDTPPPPPPWKHEVAVAFMDESPDAAEATLRNTKNERDKLDYALFLHAFRPPSPARDTLIRSLIASVDTRSLATVDAYVIEVTGKPVAYDGTDASLVPSLQIASSAGAAQTHSAFYAIPCPVMRARPGLSKAIDPMFGGNRDNFIPRSGCAWGRGRVRGFPDEDLGRFTDAAETADGDFYMNRGGTLRFSLMSALQAQREALKTNPKAMLEGQAPALAYPYETWGYMSLENRATALRLKRMYEALRDKLVGHFMASGLVKGEAEAAAKAGLFRAVWGAECGNAAPKPSLRKLLMDRAPAAEIEAFVSAGEHKKPEAIEPLSACAELAGKDPLMHVAVGYPEALPILVRLRRALVPGEGGAPDLDVRALDLELDANARNAFGKTPLMAAAQAGEIESARLLLAEGARVNADTWQPDSYTPLAHDARTALMYAASRGSLALIELLLDAGADRFQADTKGRRALDYLVGRGPLSPNPKLSPEERAKAARLLF